MAYNSAKTLRWLLAMTAVMVFGSSRLRAAEPQTKDASAGQYFADATLFSCQPGQESTTYSSHGSGGVGPQGTLGLGVWTSTRQFDVRMTGELKAQKFAVTVTVTPGQQDKQTKAQETNYDLSDLNPRSVEIARDADGRVYKLNIVPRIILTPKPAQFNARDLRPERWGFPSSPVILNDQDYLGQLGMTGGTLAWCDIPGLAKIEFSLLHLKDALPLGTLSDGVLTITHENDTLRISNVTNGTFDEVLRGGPYQVWVRWNKPSVSETEYHLLLKAQIALLKAKAAAGDMSLPPGTLDRLEKMDESGRVGLLSNGVTDAKPDDVMEPAQ